MTGLPSSTRTAIDRIEAVPAVRRIILFGSRAVGDADERSDIDLAISAPDLDRAGFSRRATLWRQRGPCIRFPSCGSKTCLPGSGIA